MGQSPGWSEVIEGCMGHRYSGDTLAFATPPDAEGSGVTTASCWWLMRAHTPAPPAAAPTIAAKRSPVPLRKGLGVGWGAVVSGGSWLIGFFRSHRRFPHET
jgi:hypothetical protein